MARRHLPSLNALRAFEAFGRHGRMTLAADELCVTHGAVSRQIRQLEEQLGVALTEGPRSRLRMTEAGLKLAQALSPAFDQIEAAVPQPVPVGPRPLVVSCLPTFAMKWLIPRLPSFQAAHPDIPVRVAESNGPFDFKADGIDLAIRMRSPETVVTYEAEVWPFMEHYHGPIMSPETAAAAPMSLERICTMPRLLTRTFFGKLVGLGAQFRAGPPAAAGQRAGVRPLFLHDRGRRRRPGRGDRAVGLRAAGSGQRTAGGAAGIYAWPRPDRGRHPARRRDPRSPAVSRLAAGTGSVHTSSARSGLRLSRRALVSPR